MPKFKRERGANSKKVQRKRNKAEELESLAEIAVRRYYAKRTPAYRALALERISRLSAIFGAILMTGFGGWSAVGVHAGVTKNSGTVSATDSFAGWILEPVILACIAAVVILRAALALTGGRLSPVAWVIELALLVLSFAANVNALPDNPGWPDYVMRFTGPIGCLLVSIVLVLADSAVRKANIDIEFEVSTARSNRWAGVRERVADTVSTATGRLVNTVADKISGVSVDTASTPSTTPVDASTDTRVDGVADGFVDVHANAPTVSTDSVHAPASTVSTSITSVDATVDGRVDTEREASTDTSTDVRGRHARPSKDDVDATEQTVQMPAVQTLTTVEDAMDSVRKLIDDEGVDAVRSMSFRALASRIDCSKTTAGKARERVLDEFAEQEQDVDRELVASGTES